MNDSKFTNFLSYLSNKYESSSVCDENQIMVQADNLLLQFGIKTREPKNIQNKISKPKKINPTVKEYPGFPKKNQISVLIIAPEKQIFNDIDSSGEKTVLPFPCIKNPENSMNCINEIQNTIRSSRNKNAKNSTANETTKSSKKKPLDSEILDLLDEIEADFSISSHQKMPSEFNEDEPSLSSITMQFRRNHKQANGPSNKKNEKSLYNNEKIEKSTTKQHSHNENMIMNHISQNGANKEMGKINAQMDEIENRINIVHENQNVNPKTSLKDEISSSNHELKLKKAEQQFRYHVIQIYFAHWKSAYSFRNKQCKLKIIMKRRLLKYYINKWIKMYDNKKRNSLTINEFTRMKEIVQIGYDYQKQIFLRKFLLIWSSKAHLHAEDRQKKEDEEANMNPHLKVKLRKQKLIKKSPPPPIIVNETMEEMIKQNKEIKENKMKKVKNQIKEDKRKQIQAEKEKVEKEKRKRMKHLKELQKQKLERQMKMRNEEEKVRNERIYSELCRKAEFHYHEMLKRRVVNQWSKLLDYRFYQEEQCRNYLLAFIKELYFYRMKSIFLCHDNERLVSASNYYNFILMKRIIKAVQKVIADKNSKISAVIRVSHFHLLHSCMNEWKTKLIARNRLNNLKADEFYEKLLLKRCLKAFHIGQMVIADESKRNSLKNKLLEKAHQYWNENSFSNDHSLQVSLGSTLKNENSAIYLENATNHSNGDDKRVQQNNDNSLDDSIYLSLNLSDQQNNDKSDEGSDDFF